MEARLRRVDKFLVDECTVPSLGLEAALPPLREEIDAHRAEINASLAQAGSAAIELLLLVVFKHDKPTSILATYILLTLLC